MFINLNTKTIYSIMDSTIRREDLISNSLESGCEYVAIANHNNAFELYDFELACKANGLKPILGIDFTVQHEDDENNYSNLKLYAENELGYKTLVHLATIANTGNKQFPYITMSDLEGSKGVVCLTGGNEGELLSRFIAKKDINSLLDKYISIFGKDNVYIELTYHYIKEEKEFLENANVLASIRSRGLKTVLTNSAHYLLSEHSYHRSLIVEMNANPEGYIFRDKYTNYNDHFYLKSEEELRLAFEWIDNYPEVFDSSLEIARRCSNVSVPITKELPEFPLPDGVLSEHYLIQEAWKGFTERFGDYLWYTKPEDILNNENDFIIPEGHTLKEYVERMEYELKVVLDMGFTDYFLIVSDYTSWCKDKEVYAHPEKYFPLDKYDYSKIPSNILNKNYEIYVGPGRGSAAGSLLAYCLKITEAIDPIEYGLLFERFLNAERVSMPDVDTDFSNKDREKVVEFCQYKYGYERVAQIATFQTLGPKSLIKAVGKVLGLPYVETDALTKEVPMENKQGKKLSTLAELKEFEFFQNQINDNETIAKLFEFGKVLDGIPSSTGKHAAGVIIGRVPLQDVVALMEVDGVLVTQFEKRNCEDIGLLKMDFLGLKTEDIIQDTVEMIEEALNLDIDINKIPLDDDKTFDLLQLGLTTNVFQFEGMGMKNLLKRLKPTRFEQLAAVTSLYRPGPMQYIPNYIEAERNQHSIDWPHPIFKEVTKETNGILIYQEQIMELVQKMAGFSLGEADILRRGIGKKVEKYLKEGRDNFVNGAQALHDIPPKLSNAIYDTIVKFADYGFNKSHAVAYALISYQTAYLKAHFPIYFMCSCLNLNALNADKLAITISEVQRMGIALLPPKIGKSKFNFSVEGNAIRFGYEAIKNVGIGLAQYIETKSSQDSFQNIINSIPAEAIRANQLENMIYAGVFDEYNSRKTLKDNLLSYLETSRYISSLNELGVKNFFDEIVDANILYSGEYAELKKAQLERKAISCILSKHPLMGVRNTIDSSISEITTANISEIMNNSDNTSELNVTILLMIEGVHKITTKKGDFMAALKLGDEYGEIEGVVFPREYAKIDKVLALATGQPAIIKGVIQKREKDDEVSLQVVVNDVESLSKPSSKLFVNRRDIDMEIEGVFRGNPGNTEVIVVDTKNKSVELLEIYVDLNDELLKHLTKAQYRIKK